MQPSTDSVNRRANQQSFPSAGLSPHSRAAWDDAQKRLPARVARCYQVALLHGKRGVTGDELEVSTGISHQSMASILLAMRRKGILVERGFGPDHARLTRLKKNAQVYVAVPFDEAVENPVAGVNPYKITCQRTLDLLRDGNTAAAIALLEDTIFNS